MKHVCLEPLCQIHYLKYLQLKQSISYYTLNSDFFFIVVVFMKGLFAEACWHGALRHGTNERQSAAKWSRSQRGCCGGAGPRIHSCCASFWSFAFFIIHLNWSIRRFLVTVLRYVWEFSSFLIQVLAMESGFW